jgi:hypothetical protein
VAQVPSNTFSQSSELSAGAEPALSAFWMRHPENIEPASTHPRILDWKLKSSQEKDLFFAPIINSLDDSA